MKAYGKWTVRNEWDGEEWRSWVRRTATTNRYPLGFHWRWERVEEIKVPDEVLPDALCRLLNGESKPVTLQDRSYFGIEYRFSTEELKAEIARRKKEFR